MYFFLNAYKILHLCDKTNIFHRNNYNNLFHTNFNLWIIQSAINHKFKVSLHINLDIPVLI